MALVLWPVAVGANCVKKDDVETVIQPMRNSFSEEADFQIGTTALATSTLRKSKYIKGLLNCIERIRRGGTEGGTVGTVCAKKGVLNCRAWELPRLANSSGKQVDRRSRKSFAKASNRVMK